MNKRKEGVWWLSIYIFFLVFVGVSFILVAMGADAYKRVHTLTEHQFLVQTPMSYMRVKIRQNDRVDGVKIGEVEGVEALVLREEVVGTWYETWLYPYDGYLREIYIMAGDTITLESGEKVIELDGMTVAMDEDKTVYLKLYMKMGEIKEERVVLQSR